MAEFSVRFSNIENSIEFLSHHAVQLNEIKQEVASVKKSLTGLGSATYNIYSILSRIDRAILDKALAMHSLAGALEKISAYYLNTEKDIASTGIQNAGSTQLTDDVSAGTIAEDIADTIESIWKSIRASLVSWGIIKAEKQVRKPGEAVTQAQQKEMDLYMQNQIEKLLKQKRYSEKTWNDASLQERQDILNEYLQDVASIMGLEIGPINFDRIIPNGSTYAMGAYSNSQKEIIINTWVMEDNVPDSYRLMSTIVHEMRHAYQHAVCENPEQFVVTEETIQSWQDSIINYKDTEDFMSEGMSESEAYEAYRDQSVEVDARWFAGQD